MANLGKKNAVFIARFRYNGKEYKRSLKTLDKSDAVAAMHDIQRVLHRLAIGMIQIPAGINPGDFIASGGTIQAVSHREPVLVPTLAAAIAAYHDHLMHLAESTRYTIRVHLNNLQKHLATKPERSIEQVRHADLDGFIQTRLKVRSSTTVRKEQETLIKFFEWVVARQYLEKSPAAELRLCGRGQWPMVRTQAVVRYLLEGEPSHRVQIAWANDCRRLGPAGKPLLVQFRRDSREAICRRVPMTVGNPARRPS